MATRHATNVFESIESAHDYVGLLCDALDEAACTIEGEIDGPVAGSRPRQMDALRLVDYKLKTLRQHFVASRLLLNDLRTLRRYLLDERVSSDEGAVESPLLVSSEASA